MPTHRDVQKLRKLIAMLQKDMVELQNAIREITALLKAIRFASSRESDLLN
jgi:prefoldin subunit 5